MKLTAYEYGTTEINEAMAFADGDPEKKCPIGAHPKGQFYTYR